jgi:SPP1 family predicted phage head-tail adaptor
VTTCGEMRHRATVQARTVSQDAFGAFTQTWSTETTRWCRLEPLSAREVFQAQQVPADISHRITMRFLDGLSTQHRIVIDSVTYEVASVVNPDGRKRFHVALVIERE